MTTTTTRASQTDLLEKIREIVRDAASPAEELVACGQALVRIGEALKGFEPEQARSVLRAVLVLEGRAV